MFLLDIKVEDTKGVARYKGLTGCSRQVLCQEQETPPPQKPRCLVVSWKPTGAQEWLAELGEFLWNFTNFEFKDSEKKLLTTWARLNHPAVIAGLCFNLSPLRNRQARVEMFALLQKELGGDAARTPNDSTETYTPKIYRYEGLPQLWWIAIQFQWVTLKLTKLYRVMGYKPLAMGYNPVVTFRTSAGQQGLSSLRPTTRPQSKGVRSLAPQELSNGGYIPINVAILLVKMMIVHGKWGCLPGVNAGMCSYPSLGWNGSNPSQMRRKSPELIPLF